jgi:nucleolar GTP-binding protein
MSFQDIPKVEPVDAYLDGAFRRGRERAQDIKSKKKRGPITLGQTKDLELEVMKAAAKSLIKGLTRITESFPIYEKLPIFYQELMRCSFDVAQFRKSLGAVNWAANQVERFFMFYTGKIKTVQDHRSVVSQRAMFYGRVSSILKQVKGDLHYLEECRRDIKRFPMIKENMKTVAIFGFPNLGKTTLLSKLTESRPEIAAYPFTTKNINVGNIEFGINKIQLLDTPGTLNRFEKMNQIERQAHLALMHVADAIVYIFDLTEPYPIEDQKKLYKEAHALGKPLFIYLSKTDILDAGTVSEFRKKYICYTDPQEIKDALIELFFP